MRYHLQDEAERVLQREVTTGAATESLRGQILDLERELVQARAERNRAEQTQKCVRAHRMEHLVIARALFQRRRRQPEQKRHQHAERNQRNRASAGQHRRMKKIAQQPRQHAEPGHL